MPERLVFDPFNAEISRGINLIEASAGTGKTFSIAMLVLRAVIERGVTVDRILVVTYTIAATDELRERIRDRLKEARSMIDRQPRDADDLILRRVLDHAGTAASVRQRLDLALLDIDRAPIMTIHSFCQTILRDLALESGHPFDFQIIADTSPLRDRLVKDFWRLRLYPLPPRYSRLVCAFFPGPNDLYRSIAGVETAMCEVLPQQLSLESAFDLLEQRFAGLCQWWKAACENLAGCLDAAIREGYLKVADQQLCPRLLVELSDCLEQGTVPPPALVSWMTEQDLLQRLNGTRLRSLEKKREVLADWPLPGAIVTDYLDTVSQLVCAFRRELVVYLRSELPRQLQRSGSIGFDDLIAGLDKAMNGTAGGMLCRQIGERFAMALIDEFQDTDNTQWSIFSRLFGSGNHYLYLIGDPKQAIYRFRGADVHSYYAAREQADRCLTMEENFRTQPDLMTAVNELFTGIHVDQHPYRSVRPAPNVVHGRLVESSGQQPGLVYCHLEPPDGARAWSTEAAGETIATWVAAEVLRLIGERGPMLLPGEPQQVAEQRRLVPADIAILVRSNREAAAYQDLLRCLGIPAVVTTRRSVFRTSECEELLLVLRALRYPGDTQLLRTALGCDWFGLDGAEHWQVCGDEVALTAIQERFRGYFRIWQERGFLPMFTDMLRTEQIFRRLGRLPGAQRRLANIMHLAELVQEQQLAAHLTAEQCVSWLRQVATGSEITDDAQIRLESDDKSLQIVTMHSAKGLEFPVVFCTSLLRPAYQQNNDQVVFAHNESGQRICDLGSQWFEQHRSRALEEEQKENMRLAYVAITRAKLRCYLLWAEIMAWGNRPSSFAAPLGQLLFRSGYVDSEGQAGHLEMLGKKPACGYLRIARTVSLPSPYVSPRNSGEAFRARDGHGLMLLPIKSRTSFSGLSLLTEPKAHEQPSIAGAFDETRWSPSQPNDDDPLPAGVRFGTVVHELLETVSFVNLARGEVDDAVVQSCCRRSGCVVDSESLRTFLRRCVMTPLLGATQRSEEFALADLNPEELVKEMNFTLRLQPRSTEQINDLLLVDPAFVPLSAKRISGYLTGFVDLVCCRNQRYYIVDYKTNRLGDADNGYGSEALLTAMRAHNYGLQYWLYTVVLHRYLSRWLPGYRYADHFGGVLYLFVRGMRPDRPGGAVYYTVPDEQTVMALDSCFGAEYYGCNR